MLVLKILLHPCTCGDPLPKLNTATVVLFSVSALLRAVSWKSADDSDLQSKSKSSLDSSSSSAGRTDMDGETKIIQCAFDKYLYITSFICIVDLLSMIERLSNDKLVDQRISPTPVTPEPPDQRSSSEDLKKLSPSEMRKLSPSEMRKRSQSQGKKRSPTNLHHHRPLAGSKSTDSIDTSRVEQQQQQHPSHHYTSGHDKHRWEKKSRDNLLRPPGTSHKGTHITRTQSGGVMLDGGGIGNHGPSFPPRSLSPPSMNAAPLASSAQDLLRSRNLSPPPPTSKPPPLPSHAKRPGGSSRGLQQQQAPPSRWSGVSFKSTDSASSEDSLTADLPPRHPRQHGGAYGSSEQVQGNMESRTSSLGSRPGGNGREQPQYFPRAHTQSSQVLAYTQHQDKIKLYQPNSAPRSNMGGHPGSDYPTYPLDSIVKNAYTGNSSAVNNTQHSRKQSWQGKPMDYSNVSHPLQTSAVSRGHSQPIGSTLTSYPWHSVHNIPSHHKHQPIQPQQR